MCGFLLYHFVTTMTSSLHVDIQMITFVNAYDVGREGTLVTSLHLCTAYFLFMLMA